MKQLKEMSVVELKALAYEQLVQMEQTQNNLKVINQEIGSRATGTMTEAPKEVVEEEKKEE